MQKNSITSFLRLKIFLQALGAGDISKGVHGDWVFHPIMADFTGDPGSLAFPKEWVLVKISPTKVERIEEKEGIPRDQFDFVDFQELGPEFWHQGRKVQIADLNVCSSKQMISELRGKLKQKGEA